MGISNIQHNIDSAAQHTKICARSSVLGWQWWQVTRYGNNTPGTRYSDITFSCSSSRASWSPTAFMSVFCRAEVMYMCMSRNRSMAPPCSACSISSCDSREMNHSKLRCSRLIQKKSTFLRFITWKYHMLFVNSANALAQMSARSNTLPET